MLDQYSPFETETGSGKLGNPKHIAFLVCVVVISAILISRLELAGGLLLVFLPFVATYIYLLFVYPIIGFYTAFALGFFLLGLARYMKGVQVGLATDGILIFTYIALFFNRFKEKVDWSPAGKDITYLSLIWFAYSLFEVVNPEARSSAAWFSGRGVSLYMLLLVPLTLLFIDTNKKLDYLFLIWGIFTILACLKGIMQLNLGVDKWEKGWLDDGNAQTHILFGKLRAFSFMSDAGQFGGNQAYSGVVAIIVSLVQKDWRKKLFFIIVGIFGLYGMVISGTRGAISIPLTGFLAFFVLRKNLGVMIFGFLLLIVVFIFFKYTSIGQGNDQIRRMRTAFDPNDASLQVRLENQKRLRVYLATRPFGGGIGLGGVKAQRYLPNAFLSNIATDSWYVLIWVEQGIVGLMLHLFILFYVLIKGAYNVMFRIRDPVLKMKMAALTSGMFGVMVASYGNAVLGQMPTSIVIYVTMALMLNSEKLDIPKNGYV
ncbi:MAG: O-antigen ligase family protein [Bacteroidota bacterium]